MRHKLGEENHMCALKVSLMCKPGSMLEVSQELAILADYLSGRQHDRFHSYLACAKAVRSKTSTPQAAMALA